MAKLRVLTGNRRSQEVALGKKTVLGRSEECDIQVESPRASRNHAAVRFVNGSYVVEDLNTPNGTWVNGRRITRATLGAGDTIRVGDSQLMFLSADSDTVQTAGPSAGAPSVITTIDVHAEPGEEFHPAHTGARLREHLEVLREVAATSCGAQDIRVLLERMLHLLLRVYPQADHAHVLVSGLEEEGEELHLSANSGEAPAEGAGMSRTLYDTARREKMAILAADPMADGRLSSSVSIVQQSLRSLMCSPLVMGERVLGGIQVSTTRTGQSFGQEDLQLLTTVAGQIAVAAENTRLHAEMVAKERLAAVGQTVSSLAHCIKNVINGLKGGAYILEAGLKREDQEKVAKGWEMVRRNNDFMFDLVKDMLAYCRKSPLRREPTDMAELIRDTVSMVQERAAQAGIRACAVLPPDLPSAEVDPTGMKRVVLNLLSNAVEACSQGCTVRVVAAEGDADRMRITVADDGPGIPEEIREQLFEPFFTTKGSAGTGLGLALVRKMVEEPGGVSGGLSVSRPSAGHAADGVGCSRARFTRASAPRAHGTRNSHNTWHIRCGQFISVLSL